MFHRTRIRINFLKETREAFKPEKESDFEAIILISEVRKQTLSLITAALGFVAALVWKDAITAWLAPLYEGSQGSAGLTIAALVVTIVVVILTYVLSKWLGDKR